MSFLLNFYFDILDSGDPRLKDWMFMESPVFTLAITVAYIYFVTSIGPRLMRDRKAFDLRSLMIAYNFAMVLISAYMFTMIGKFTNWGRDSFQCKPMDYSPHNERGVKMITLGWWFLISKFVELCDTIFFVLRKKQNQVSFLHVLHHSVVPITVWVGLKFACGEINGFFPFLNSGVHTIMYAYYGLSALGPHMREYLWWKKYITTLQMAQFVMAIAHGVRFLLQYKDCEFPQSFIFINLFHAILFFYLFSSFYRQSYNKRKSPVEMSATNKSAEASARIGGLKITASVGYH